MVFAYGFLWLVQIVQYSNYYISLFTGVEEIEGMFIMFTFKFNNNFFTLITNAQ